MNEQRFELAHTRGIANRILKQLAPHCWRIEIAGSIRREKAEVGDIEIVCIPKMERVGLFGEMERVVGFGLEVNRWEHLKGHVSDKYIQRLLPEGVKLDLFTATAGNWGLILAIRTGSADFSHNVLAKGWVKAGYHSKGGMLTRKDAAGAAECLEIREESELFDLIGLSWIDPKDRK